MSTPTHVWPTLIYDDAPAAIAFLCEAFGFETVADFRREGDERIVEHAQLRWPFGGGVMLGTANKDDSAFSTRPVGMAATYVVCTDPDELFARATAQGATVVMALTDQPYGSRDFSVRDPEGNIWAFGTYAGES